MKSGTKFLQWLTFVLCMVMLSGVLTPAAGADMAIIPTGKCTNVYNEGIEYFVAISELTKDTDKWRSKLTASAVLAEDGTNAGDIVAIEAEVVNTSGRFQCTEIIGPPNTFSCNSIPTNGLLSGIYLLYKPSGSASVDKEVIFKITNELDPLNPITLVTARGPVKMPPYPCAREILTNDMKPAAGDALVFYTGEGCECSKKESDVKTCDTALATCLSSADTLDKVDTCYTTHDTCIKAIACEKDSKGNDILQSISEQSITFYEQKPEFAIVNIIDGDTLKGADGDTYPYDASKNRVRIEVDPDAEFDYDLDLVFEVKNPDTGKPKEVTVTYHYDYDPAAKKIYEKIDAASIDGLKIDNLPLTLKRGSIYNLKPEAKDGWGNPTIPSEGETTFNFHIRFWYENIEGTLGFENSVFHFERDVFTVFSPDCAYTASAEAFYDTCQTSRQLFSVKLSNPIALTDSSTTFPYKVPNSTLTLDTKKDAKATRHWVVTRKCVNSDCSQLARSNAYIYSMTFADGGSSSITYRPDEPSHTVGNRQIIDIFPHANKDHPFKIVGVSLVVDEPGTYVVVPFLPKSETEGYVPSASYTTPGTYKPAFYVTVPETQELLSCVTQANNGYFKANWNDCLDSRLTQLLTFEHIPGKEEAWMENRSNTDIYFPYVHEWSYLPQELQIASLTYKATALSDAGRPGLAWCNPEGCLVPPYTRVTITGGTFYLDSEPKFDEYRVAYARRDTYNISHLFFNVYVKECERRIPNTGISLRSPLKINERIDAAAPATSITRTSFQSPLKINARVNDATSYVFTGNSLRIPAIGLGMETPIPIVHVYYEDGSDGMKWDLSTLGNYVGELEGGSYIPYGGNSVLTGHYWSGGVFKNLEHLNLEDEIYIYGNDGVKYVYKVVQKFIAQPDDVYEMFQQVGDRSLTLVTCENYNLVTDEYERRYIVRAVLESQDLYEEGVW